MTSVFCILSSRIKRKIVKAKGLDFSGKNHIVVNFILRKAVSLTNITNIRIFEVKYISEKMIEMLLK